MCSSESFNEDIAIFSKQVSDRYMFLRPPFEVGISAVPFDGCGGVGTTETEGDLGVAGWCLPQHGELECWGV